MVLEIIDGNAATKFVSASGAGSNVDPYVTGHQTVLSFKDDQRITCNAASQAVTIPANTLVAVFNAEGGAVRYAINAAASATSAGRVPQDSTIIVFLSGAANAAVYGASGAYANIVYYG